MNNKNQVTEEVPGTDSDVGVPDVAKVRKWVDRDLSACINFLTAINSDGPLKDQLSIFLHGRILNHVNRPDPASIQNKKN